MNLTFGTDGWRGKIGDVFTDSNLSIVTQATCDYLLSIDSNRFVAIGYDNRFRSEQYAQIVAEIFSSNGFEVLLSDEAVSTPVVSYITNRFKTSLGICITASHNPPEYNGYKIKENFGGSALSSTIDQIIPFLGKTLPKNGDSRKITKIDFTAEYFVNLRQMFDLQKIASHFKDTPVNLNYMHGSSSGYIGEVFKNIYLPTLEYNMDRNVLFGGFNPEPIPKNMKEFMSLIRSGLGFAFDGDGDRIAGVTSSGEYVNSSQLMAIAIPHLKRRSTASRCAFTVSCSDIAHRVASKEGLQVVATKIGFKHIADLMISKPPVLIGGEESGGIGFINYLPERDGIANALLIMEALAFSGINLDVAISSLEDKFGKLEQRRVDLHVTDPDDIKKSLKELAENPNAFLPTESVDTLDGVKLRLLDQSWIMFRLSGTEPLLRIYAESESSVKTLELIEKGKKFLCR